MGSTKRIDISPDVWNFPQEVSSESNVPIGNASASWKNAPWWVLSVFVATLAGTISVFTLILLEITWKWAVISGGVVFLAVAVFMVFCDPRHWPKRMALFALTALVSGNCVSGLEVSVPVCWHAQPIEFTLPAASSLTACLLAGLVVYFASVHFHREHASKHNPPP